MSLNINQDGSATVAMTASGYRRVEMPLSHWVLLTRDAKSLRQFVMAVDAYAAENDRPKAMAAGAGR